MFCGKRCDLGWVVGWFVQFGWVDEINRLLSWASGVNCLFILFGRHATRASTLISHTIPYQVFLSKHSREKKKTREEIRRKRKPIYSIHKG